MGHREFQIGVHAPMRAGGRSAPAFLTARLNGQAARTYLQGCRGESCDSTVFIVERGALRSFFRTIVPWRPFPRGELILRTGMSAPGTRALLSTS